ncbi:MAG: ATP-binding cassette domain-containing protein [Acidimicrobiales bacterium]|nr:ATP-binding cassette domain-containing protein [Acidimicrobiales bacterium]
MESVNVLEIKGVTKKFGGLTSLDNVNIVLGEQTIHGLIGPNGAGKTTLFSILSGELRPDNGDIYFLGRSIKGLSPPKRARLGIGRTFQRLELFKGMTVSEHVLISLRCRDSNWGNFSLDQISTEPIINLTTSSMRTFVISKFHFFRQFSRGAPSPNESEKIKSLLMSLNLSEVADRQVESLPLGHGRLVEMARALALSPQVLLLDEPSSGLDSLETQVLSNAIKAVVETYRCSVIIVEHDIKFVERLASVVTVLDAGKIVASGETKTVLRSEKVRAIYSGIST